MERRERVRVVCGLGMIGGSVEIEDGCGLEAQRLVCRHTVLLSVPA